MGFWTGFVTRAGERAHEENLLDMQQKVEKHKNFMEHLNKIAEDPTYLPEAQMAARRKWMEASQQGPMKFKNYDISDIMTVKSPKLTSGPSPPTEEGGAADVTRPQFFSPRDPTATHPGKWDPFELAAMEAEQKANEQRRMYEETIKYRKELVKPMADPVDSRINVRGEDGQWYQQVTHRSGKQDTYGPIPPNYKPGDVQYDPDTQQWIRTKFDPQQGEYERAQTPGSPLVPGTRVVKQHDGRGNFYDVVYDQRGNITGWARATPSRYQVGTTSTREQPVVTGGDIIRQEYTTTTQPMLGTPSFNPPETLPPGLTPVEPTAAAPQIPPPPPTAPPAAGQPAVPSPAAPQAAPAAPSVVTPAALPVQPPVASRTSKEALAAATPKALPPVRDDTPVDSKSVGPSMNVDFSPTRGGDIIIPAGKTGGAMTIPMLKSGQAYSRRMDVIHRTAGPLSEFQRERMGENEATLRQAIYSAREVYTRVNLLDSMITAGRLTIAVDPRKPYQLVTRVIGGLSPKASDSPAERKRKEEEATLAAHFISLMEDIQKMRTPMGGAGFRSLEAFMALQGQRGSLLGSPEITKNVLRNSMRVFLSLRGKVTHALAQDARTSNPISNDTADLYYQSYYENTKRAVEAMKLDGWDPPTQ